MYISLQTKRQIMKEELIKFETAKLAKEKGFNIEGYYYYDEDNQELLIHDDDAFTVQNTKPDICWYAPTQSLLQKWLREEHDIIVWVTPYTNGGKKCTFLWNIGGIDNIWRLLNFSMEKHPTFELALESGLQEALKLI